MTVSIIVAANAESADREIIASGIRAFNESRAGSSQASPLAVLLKDDGGQTVGGLWGRTRAITKQTTIIDNRMRRSISTS